jgi:hypothetical protein
MIYACTSYVHNTRWYREVKQRETTREIKKTLKREKRKKEKREKIDICVPLHLSFSGVVEEKYRMVRARRI